MKAGVVHQYGSPRGPLRSRQPRPSLALRSS